jgi:DNA-binding transcriptional MerR regulator
MANRDPKTDSRKKRIRSLIVAGYSIQQIKEMCSYPESQIQEFFDTLKSDIKEEIKSRVKQIHFGSKNEAYYPTDLYTEDELIKLFSGENKTGLELTYNYEDLPDEEKEFYESQNKIHRHSTEFFTVSYIGYNSDHRKNRWICTCKLCNKRFAQPLSLWSKKEVKCPDCRSSQVIDFDNLK